MYFIFCFCFLGQCFRHMEVPRLGVQSELQLPASTTDTATWDPSHLCNPKHSSQQHWILSLLSETRDPTRILLVTIWAHYHLAKTRTPAIILKAIHLLQHSFLSVPLVSIKLSCSKKNTVFVETSALQTIPLLLGRQSGFHHREESLLDVS